MIRLLPLLTALGTASQHAPELASGPAHHPIAQLRTSPLATYAKCSAAERELHVTSLSLDRASALLTGIDGGHRFGKFARGYSVAGPCAASMTRMFPFITFANGSSYLPFGTPANSLEPVKATPLEPDSFMPTGNVLKLPGARFNFASSLKYVGGAPFGTIERLAFWANKEGSLVGTIRCPEESSQNESCVIGDVFAKSPYRVRQVGFIPNPHGSVFALRLWISLPSGQQVYMEHDFESLPS